MAGRIGVVREACGLAAYAAGEWNEALADLRAARRITGQAGHLAVLAAQAGMVAPQSACTLKLGTKATDTCTAATRGSTPNPFGPPPGKPAVINPEPIIHEVPYSVTWGGDTALG